MDIHTIPDLFLNEADIKQPLNIKYYRAQQSSMKNKVRLSKALICFLLDGQKNIHLSERQIAVSSGQAFIIPAGNCIMTEKLPMSGSYRSILLFFDTASLSNLLLKYEQPGKTESMASDFSFGSDEFISAYLKGLESLLAGEKQISTKMLQLKFEEIILYLLEKYGSNFAAFLYSICAPRAELAFRKVIEDNIYSNLNLGEIAFLCNMSIATFKRQFNKLYGMPPIQWFHNKKMERAKLLLSKHLANPGDIYAELGYENLSSFSSAFRKKFGKAPREFQSA